MDKKPERAKIRRGRVRGDEGKREEEGPFLRALLLRRTVTNNHRNRTEINKRESGTADRIHLARRKSTVFTIFRRHCRPRTRLPSVYAVSFLPMAQNRDYDPRRSCRGHLQIIPGIEQLAHSPVIYQRYLSDVD